MFTGLIEEIGSVSWLRKRETGGFELAVVAKTVIRGIRKGDSIAVNGCCLTVTDVRNEMLLFDLLAETLNKSNLSALRPDHLVNLERCLTPNSRLGGHFVQGHIDCVTEVLDFAAHGADWRLDVGIPDGFAQYLAYKGSVALNGISLTVAEVNEAAFRVWIIPHTREVTNFRQLSAGDFLNVEFDILAKYVERQMALRPPA